MVVINADQNLNISYKRPRLDLWVLMLPRAKVRVVWERFFVTVTNSSLFFLSGNIVLFLPDTFTGIVHLMTRKGEMAILPALASIMKVVKTSEREVIFMIAPKNFPNGADNCAETTLCQLNTRKGNVVVGLSGRDQYLPQPGFWKKLGGYLRGDKH